MRLEVGFVGGVLHTPKNKFVANAVRGATLGHPQCAKKIASITFAINSTSSFPHHTSIKQRKGLKMAEKKDLKQEKLHSIYLFYGEEAYLLESAVKNYITLTSY